MKRPDFPLIWDNSMRSALVACPWKFANEYMLHYRGLRVSEHLHAGKAFASALEAARMAYYGAGKNQAEAEALGMRELLLVYGDFQAPPGSNKALPRMMEALAYYFAVFPFEHDPAQPYMSKNGPMVEFGFALPLHDDLLHPETGEPLLYTGRADMVATFAGALSIYDDKTTSSLGPQWANQWDRRSQFSGYAWAAQMMGLPVTQILVRGISILKTKIDHAEVISIRSAHHIAEWHEQAVRDIRRAIKMWREGYWDKNLSDTCSSFGGCMFRAPCGAIDPAPYFFSNFTRRRWDPTTREEITLEHFPQSESETL